MTATGPIHVVRGSDPVLVSESVGTLVEDLLGPADRNFALDELTGEDYDLGAVVDAASTPPLFGDRRVVVARGCGRFTKKDDVASLVTYLETPMETSVIVLVWEPAPGQQRLGAVPKALAGAVTAAGGRLTDVDPGSAKGAREDWWAQAFAASEVTLDASARRAIRERLGEDLAGAPALLRLLTNAFGPGTHLDASAVEPFLGDAGGVPPWELTDAIGWHDTAGALDALHRMLGAGERHPLQIMATLAANQLRIARLSGAEARGERAAADLLGMKGSTFPAKKALAASDALGPEGARQAVRLCAQADLALRGGGVAWPGELVLEVLVARLCRLGRTRRGRGAPGVSRRR